MCQPPELSPEDSPFEEVAYGYSPSTMYAATDAGETHATISPWTSLPGAGEPRTGDAWGRTLLARESALVSPTEDPAKMLLSYLINNRQQERGQEMMLRQALYRQQADVAALGALQRQKLQMQAFQLLGKQQRVAPEGKGAALAQAQAQQWIAMRQEAQQILLQSTPEHLSAMRRGISEASPPLAPVPALHPAVQNIREESSPVLHQTYPSFSSAVAAAVAAVAADTVHPTASPFSFALDDEKKVKRILANRASAKRSRDRKRARMEELDKTTAQLLDEKAMISAELEEAEERVDQLNRKNWSLQIEIAQLKKKRRLECSGPSDKGSELLKSHAASSKVCSSPRVKAHGYVKTAGETVTADGLVEEEESLENEWSIPLTETMAGGAVGSSRVALTNLRENLASDDAIFFEMLAQL
jgi:DNA repair exonuclease SbcCD ATPase subunit